ncbi:MAG: N-acetyl sugar amidotransferase, partial [Calditrichia bacterium]
MAQIGNFVFLPKLHSNGRKIPYGKHVSNSKFERQLEQIPPDVKFCKKCVISNQRPRIRFDDSGVCGACRWWEEKEFIDWESRKSEFEDLLDRHRRNDGNFDVIVPSSGGKDSGTVAHKLKYKYGMNPLSVTWSPLLYTQIGFQNLQNMISSGIPSHLFTPNRDTQRIISKLGFVLVGNHFEAFGRGQAAYA